MRKRSPAPASKIGLVCRVSTSAWLSRSAYFEPTDDYSKVRSIFLRKTDASDADGRNNDDKMADNRRALAKLDLRLENSNGQAVPTGWIDIDDFSQEVGADDADAFQISAHINDLEALTLTTW